MMSTEENRDLMYLSTSKVHLNAPGVKLSNNYYSVMNSTVELVETTYNTGRLSISLTSNTFGSQSQIVIPNSSFLSDVYLHLELPNLGFSRVGGGTYTPGVTLSRGWAFAIISSINFLFGSSNVSQISMNGQSLFQAIMCQAETAEKKSEMMRLAGQEMLTPIMWVDPADGLTKPDPNAVLTADILLPLPWSSASGLFPKLPFDTNTLANPITVQIQFAQANTIYGGAIAGWPSGFYRATTYMRQGDLTNKDQSLRRTLEMNPDLSMFYPFVHKQSITPTAFIGSNDPNARVSVPLLGFINADLLSITVGVVRTQLLSNSSVGSPNVFQYDNIKNVTLEYNGLLMWSAPGDSWKLYQMQSSPGATYIQNSLIKPHASTDTTFDSIPQDTYILQMDFSRIKSYLYEGQFQNVWRIPNNTLTLSFNTESGSDTQYQLFATFYYNGIAQINQGQTSVYFD